MDENKLVQNSNEKVNVESENVFTKRARTINPVVYFFISFLNALLGVVKWLADLLFSMVTSLLHFFKMVGLGAYKGVMISKENAAKDKFKIDLLNMLNNTK